MKRATFAAFVAPSVIVMLLFIALPLLGVAYQSLDNHERIYRQQTIENCTPGFPNPVCTTTQSPTPVLDPDGRPRTQTVFVGLANFRAVLQGDFYRALLFTLTFTLVTLPLVVGIGLALALALNNTLRLLRGPIIFVSLLPFIITPVIGALSIRWLFAGDGILTAALEHLVHRPLAPLADTVSLQILMMAYRVWNTAPFAFIVFYAGLQTLNLDSLAAAVVDGASRWMRLRYVVLPHLSPLILFVSLIHVMDAYRVFDEVVGFSSQARVISLQWLTFDLLTPNGSGIRAIGRASASSLLTMVGIVILLAPLILQFRREHRRG